MAILRSLDGRFFEVPDDQVNKYLIPPDKVKEKLDAAGAPQVPPGPPSGGPGPGQGAGGPPPAIVVQIIAPPPGGPGAPPPPTATDQPAAAGAEVQPYGYWNNWWHNMRPGWNNWWHNWHN